MIHQPRGGRQFTGKQRGGSFEVPDCAGYKAVIFGVSCKQAYGKHPRRHHPHHDRRGLRRVRRRLAHQIIIWEVPLVPPDASDHANRSQAILGTNCGDISIARVGFIPYETV